jgi:hypothetical protein
MAVWRAVPLGAADRSVAIDARSQLFQPTALPLGEGAGNCAGSRWARDHIVSPLWTLQCQRFRPDQMLRQLLLTAERTVTQAGQRKFA